ncbi:unnamed protein product, partial [Ixodes persulcatus]
NGVLQLVVAQVGARGCQQGAQHVQHQLQNGGTPVDALVAAQGVQGVQHQVVEGEGAEAAVAGQPQGIGRQHPQAAGKHLVQAPPHLLGTLHHLGTEGHPQGRVAHLSGTALLEQQGQVGDQGLGIGPQLVQGQGVQPVQLGHQVNGALAQAAERCTGDGWGCPGAHPGPEAPLGQGGDGSALPPEPVVHHAQVWVVGGQQAQQRREQPRVALVPLGRRHQVPHGQLRQEVCPVPLHLRATPKQADEGTHFAPRGHDGLHVVESGVLVQQEVIE